MRDTKSNDAVVLEVKNRANDRMISHLNERMDILQQRNQDLEIKLKKATFLREEAEEQVSHYKNEIAGLSSRNRSLDMELKDVDRMAKIIRSDKKKVVETADRKMLEAKTELEMSRQDVDSLDFTVAQMKAENKNLDEHYKKTKTILEAKLDDLVRLEKLLDIATEEKSRLRFRLNCSLSNERKLVLENERMKKKSGSILKRENSSSRLDAFVRSTEEERDYYKEQNEVLEKMVRGNVPHCASPARSRSSSVSSNRIASVSTNQTISMPRSGIRGLSTTKGDKKSVTKYEEKIEALEEERDFYRKEFELSRAARISSRKSLAKSVAGDLEIARLTREKETLRALLDKFEIRMAETQANVKLLTSERDTLRTMCYKSNDDLLRARREISLYPDTPATHIATKTMLRQVENQRDDALSDLRSVKMERDGLTERMKIATESSLVEQAKLEQRIKALGTSLEKVEVERNDLQQQMTDTNFQMQERITELMKANSHIKDEAGLLKTAINAIEKEKNILQLTVAEKEEKIAELKSDLNLKKIVEDELTLKTVEISAKLTGSSNSLEKKNEEIESLKRDLSSVTEDLKETKGVKEILLSENNRLQDEVGDNSRNNGKLSHELQDALEENKTLKTKISRIQDFLSETEKEKSELLDQNRTLADEAREMISTIDELENNCFIMENDLLTRDTELQRSQKQAGILEKERNELNVLVDAMTQQNAMLETQFCTERDSLKRMEAILHSNSETEFQSQRCIREMSCEIHMLKDQLLLEESKKDSHIRENSVLKTLNGKLDKAVEKLRQRLADEKQEMSNATQKIQTINRCPYDTSVEELD
ncbi:hypothetical protein ScPMuIL_010129 [Solemya velum]